MACRRPQSIVGLRASVCPWTRSRRASFNWFKLARRFRMEGSHRVLIVEDSETQALKLQLMLEGEGCSVVWSSTAEEALEELNRNVPDLVIVDYYLPGVRGDEVCRRIRMNM